MPETQTPQRSIRSFVIRASRMTARQRLAVEQYGDKYLIRLNNTLNDITDCFSPTTKTVLEIGFGMGDSLVRLAQSRPEINFIGIEVHPPGVGACIALAAENQLSNLRVIQHDAIEVLKHHVKDHSLDSVQILFPDPWHKKKHHKRRLIQSDFLSLLAQKIVVSGHLRIATDWAHYAEHIESLLQASNEFVLAESGAHSNHLQSRINETKFEKRGLRLGHRIADFCYRVK